MKDGIWLQHLERKDKRIAELERELEKARAKLAEAESWVKAITSDLDDSEKELTEARAEIERSKDALRRIRDCRSYECCEDLMQIAAKAIEDEE